MAARQFDSVVKALGNGATRRRVLRGLVAGAGGGALIGLTRHSAEARPCDGGCGAGDRCCQNNGCYNPDFDRCFHCGQGNNLIGAKTYSRSEVCP
jgi:hypothetical protein